MRRTILVMICVSGTIPTLGSAQGNSGYSVAEGLRQFAETGDTELPVPDLPAAGWLAYVTIYPQGHAPATVDSILSGLESLAISASNPNVRSRSVHWLRQAGDVMQPSPVQGVADRLRSVFERSDDRSVRVAIMHWMPQQAESGDAVSFLEFVAADSSPAERGNDLSLAYLAVDGLTRMGSQGQAALRRLHEAGAVRNAQARDRLEALARDGFQDDTR